MGLLEDAIREHFDLRRRHGANPDAVEREERDALAPVETDRRSEGSSTSAEPRVLARNEPGGEGEERALLDGHRGRIVDVDLEDPDRSSRPREPSFMEETAEIDMRTVLGGLEDAMSSEEADGDAPVRRAIRAQKTAPVAAGGLHAAFDHELDRHSLAWETPTPRVRRVERHPDERVVRGD